VRRKALAAGERGPRALTRRRFLQTALSTVVGTLLATACQVRGQEQAGIVLSMPVPMGEGDQPVPMPPANPPDPAIRYFFSEHEARTVEAYAARLFPGTPEDPGAREADVVSYIDSLLSRDDGLPEPIYRKGPFAEPYKGDTPPPPKEGVIWVSSEGMDLTRYGYQSRLTPPEVYRIGLKYLDAYCGQRFGADFVSLSETQQDQIITSMVKEEIPIFESFSALAFFYVLRRHTNEALFSDPAYGGNRNMAAWRVIGYPGGQRAFTLDEVITEGKAYREPQAMKDLPPFYYGRPGEAPTPVPPGQSGATGPRR
jgi:gluconate 2-dehydrogenase gamma chain